jgi:heterodisulfide reductase subunit B
MKYALFLGCTIPVRAQHYEIAAREVAKIIGIEFVDIKNFSCCGFPVKSTDRETSLKIAARNLAIAAMEGYTICTLCNACTSVLTEANQVLTEDKDLRAKIDEDLKKFDLEFQPGLEIKHFSRILYEDVGLDKIRKKIVRELTPLKFSVHYGCHYLRPTNLYDCFDDAEAPSSVENLVAATGATVLDYKNKLDCCGGALLGVEEDIALAMAKQKLDYITTGKVDALVTICPFCTIMYEDNQKKIESKFNVTYNLPVLYYPQVLGLALGLDPKQLGFRLNKVKTNELLGKMEVVQ